MTTKSLKELAADYANSINESKAAERRDKEAADAALLAQKESEAAILERESAIISEFVNLVLPPLAVIHETLVENGVDASVRKWWTGKPGSEREFTAHDGRKSDKLVEFSFANHTKDPLRRSRMLFCAAPAHVGHGSSKTTSATRDAYVIYVDGKIASSAQLVLARRVENPLTTRDGTRPPAQEIEGIIGIVFDELRKSSEERCKGK